MRNETSKAANSKLEAFREMTDESGNLPKMETDGNIERSVTPERYAIITGWKNRYPDI